MCSTLFSASVAFSQKWDNLSLAAEIGAPIGSTSENLSFFVNLEPKLNVSENLLMGVRISCVVNSQTFIENNRLQYLFEDKYDHGFLSTVPTLDYFWFFKKATPYVGIGIGPYLLANYADVTEIGSANPDDLLQITIDYQFGALVRGGVEVGKARFCVEYNFVPDVKIATLEGDHIGNVESSYLGVSFGWLFGPTKK